MRKITLFTTATLLSIACIGGTTLSVDAAASKEKNSFRCGNKIIISGSFDSLENQMNDGSNCDINSVLNQIIQNLPSQNPCPPAQTPDNNIPETECPEDNMPETPEIECPEDNTPNIPEIELPEDNTPETPEVELPEDNTPETPEVELPEDNTPETPEVELPENNTPETPEVELPDTNVPNTPETEKPETNIPDTETPDNNENASYIEQVVNLVNIERAKEGLAPLTIDEDVQAAAQVRALEIETSFSHTRPNGSSFSTALMEENVSYRRAGENIAWGQRSPEEVVNAWMNSEGHRANIMNSSFTKIGVGYYQNAKGVNYWSQLFIG